MIKGLSKHLFNKKNKLINISWKKNNFKMSWNKNLF